MPFGVILICFGWMLLLGAGMQTAPEVLMLFKKMVIGLGGGLAYAFPIMFIWLGILMVVSAKRYVSLYPFVISLLLLMCFGTF